MLRTICVALLHLLITFPSFVYHGIINLYYRFTWGVPNQQILKGKNVIICVHGRGGHYTNFVPLIENLWSFIDGKYYIRTVDLGNTRHTPIDQDVDKLKKSLELYPECNIILIGLSKGGLVVTRYVTTMSDERIRRVITISSPLRGTKITKLLSKDSITHKELGYGSELTRDIAKEISGIVPINHVVPKWDHLIIPTSAAYYPTTNVRNIYHYKGMYSHTGITYSKDVAIAIATWINNTPLL